MNHNRYKMAVAVHLFLIRGDEVLLLGRFNAGYEDGDDRVVAGQRDSIYYKQHRPLFDK